MLTFETKCYENDWEFLLKGPRLQQMAERCGVDFTRRVVIINNVRNTRRVKRHADKKVREGVIDAYYVAEEHAAEALTFFDIDPQSFRGGYYYSIAELVGIYVCQTEYLLHFSSDTMPGPVHANWIPEALAIFKERKDVLVANPTWDYRFTHAEEESFDSIGNFYLGYGFSDQCYLVRTADFRQRIYNETHPLSARYPAYGGELFEKRVDSYMRNHKLLRITSKNAAYEHKNFPKDRLDRLRMKLNMYLNRSSS
ncbi:hypothetical protein [Chitinophaga sp.]|uniref:hypothetical protein n=1 Tax=Chitinophaga sp. TaxID=1869181 RepID=UPI0031D2E8A6